VTPLLVFRRAAVAEAITWGLLLVGMFLKHVTHTTELGVRVFGMLHGVVFIAFCLVTLLVAVDQKWSRGRVVLGLASSVPPFATIAFDRYAEHRGMLDDHWHTSPETNETAAERVVCWLLRHHVAALASGAAAVAVLTAGALLVGPPAG
jgi:integral membrane protein